MVLIMVISNQDTIFPLINIVGDIELLQKISKISSYLHPYSNIYVIIIEYLGKYSNHCFLFFE